MATHALCLALLMFGCAPVSEVEEEGSGPTEIVDEGKFDSASELRARVTGLSVWIDKSWREATRDGRGVWLVEGRASRDLDNVFSFVPDDRFCSAQVVSARRFEVFCDAGHELNSVLSGMPLLVSVSTRSGSSATAAVWIAPRLGRFSGSSKITVESRIKPVWLSGTVAYRGRAETASGYSSLYVSGAPVSSEGTRKFRFDWSYDSLVSLDRARVSSGGATKYGELEVGSTRLGLTTADPYDVFAESCMPQVKACLRSLPPSASDFEGCGSYRDVQRCGGREIAIIPDPSTIAADLKRYLYAYYQANGTPMGGNTLSQAQAAVDVNLIGRLFQSSDDPHGHDLEQFFVFSHPDVIFPGSDTVWYLAYERGWGKLSEAYDFN